MIVVVLVVVNPSQRKTFPDLLDQKVGKDKLNEGSHRGTTSPFDLLVCNGYFTVIIANQLGLSSYPYLLEYLLFPWLFLQNLQGLPSTN